MIDREPDAVLEDHIGPEFRPTQVLKFIQVKLASILSKRL